VLPGLARRSNDDELIPIPIPEPARGCGERRPPFEFIEFFRLGAGDAPPVPVPVPEAGADQLRSRRSSMVKNV